MALDEPKENDIKTELAGLTFLFDERDKEMVEQLGGVKIDYVNNFLGKGFSLSTNAGTGRC